MTKSDVVKAEKAGVVQEVSADYITTANDDGTYITYRLAKFSRSNQGTSVNQKVIVAEGDRIIEGQVLAESNRTDLGGEPLLARLKGKAHIGDGKIVVIQEEREEREGDEETSGGAHGGESSADPAGGARGRGRVRIGEAIGWS